jgi:potassium-transporting ATPase potassium-binding subunit
MSFGWTLVVLVAALGLSWRFLGSYMEAVYDGRMSWLAWLERPIYRSLRTHPDEEQHWTRYARSLIVFSGVSLLIAYGIMRLQGHLGVNPQHLGAVPPALSFNTAVSFVSNTSWQSYAGESTLSYFSQTGAILVAQFTSAAVGMAVAIALIRGLARGGADTIGNFWVDLVRGCLYVLGPIAVVAGLIFAAQGGVDTFAGPVPIHDAVNGVSQLLPRGPVASMESIKQLSSDGGGMFATSGAHPFENPTGLTNLLSIVLMMMIPVAFTYTFGKMVRSLRQGVTILVVMGVLFTAWLTFTAAYEHQANPAVVAAGVHQAPSGNMEGKEVRFGNPSSVLYDIAGTQTSSGATNSSLDSFTPIGGFGALSGMMLGEVSPGGVGSGLFSVLAFAILTVFIAGLMVGRTPEYLGKQIRAREVKLAGLAILVMPVTVLVLAAIAVSVHAGRAAPLNAGPHGFSEILYTFTSEVNTNGSAFGGLGANTAFYNDMGSLAMLVGRYGAIVPTLALAGVLARSKSLSASPGKMRTDTPMFAGLLLGVILIVGGLAFFPAASLGPIIEQLSHGRFF